MLSRWPLVAVEVMAEVDVRRGKSFAIGGGGGIVDMTDGPIEGEACNVEVKGLETGTE